MTHSLSALAWLCRTLRVPGRAAALAAAAALLMAAAVSVSAHHTVTHVVDTKTLVTLQGTIVRVHWKMPHVILQVETPRAGGGIQTWSLETKSPSGLSQVGLTQKSFTIGETLTATVCVGRDGIPWAVTRAIALPRAPSISVGGC